MGDKFKTGVAVLLYGIAITLPLFGIATLIASALGWVDVKVSTSLTISISLFIGLFVAASFLLTTVRDLSWVTVALPYFAGILYTIFDFIPLPVFSIDNAAITTAGAIFSYVLALRKEPQTPKWVFFLLIATGVYALFGGAIPFALDELIVDIGALLMAGYGINRNLKNKPSHE